MFLHAVVSASAEDVQLLDQVEESFRQVVGPTKGLQQVHAVCKIFCRLAKAFVDSNQVFTIPASEDPVMLPSLIGQDNFTAEDVSMFFGNWFGGNETTTDLWNNFDFTNPINVYQSN